MIIAKTLIVLCLEKWYGKFVWVSTLLETWDGMCLEHSIHPPFNHCLPEYSSRVRFNSRSDIFTGISDCVVMATVSPLAGIKQSIPIKECNKCYDGMLHTKLLNDLLFEELHFLSFSVHQHDILGLCLHNTRISQHSVNKCTLQGAFISGK